MSLSGAKKEAFSRVVVDAQLKDAGWTITGGQMRIIFSTAITAGR